MRAIKISSIETSFFRSGRQLIVAMSSREKSDADVIKNSQGGLMAKLTKPAALNDASLVSGNFTLQKFSFFLCE